MKWILMIFYEVKWRGWEFDETLLYEILGFLTDLE